MFNDETIAKCESWAKDIRRIIIEAAHNVGRQGVHLGSALSTVDILSVLYASVINDDVTNPMARDRDYFILSKGHAYLSYYATLAKAGFFSIDDLTANFMTDNGWLPVHPVMNIQKGIEFSGGSLGTGMPFAVGKAYALKLDERQNRVYTLVGDGECNEGSIWEAFLSAANLELSNLTVIIDKNGLQQDGATDEILKIDLASMVRSCRWNVLSVDGHSCQELLQAFQSHFDNSMPTCIIANTVKGKGVPFMEGDNNWHHSNMNEKQFALAMEVLQ